MLVLKPVFMPEHWTISGKKLSYVRRKLLHSKKQLTNIKLKKIISYQRLKTQKHSVSISLFCSGFSFYEHFNRQLIHLCSFLYIYNCKMCLSKKILCQTNILLLFLLCLGQHLCYSVNSPF